MLRLSLGSDNISKWHGLEEGAFSHKKNTHGYSSMLSGLFSCDFGEGEYGDNGNNGDGSDNGGWQRKSLVSLYLLSIFLSTHRESLNITSKDTLSICKQYNSTANREDKYR